MFFSGLLPLHCIDEVLSSFCLGRENFIGLNVLVCLHTCFCFDVLYAGIFVTH